MIKNKSFESAFDLTDNGNFMTGAIKTSLLR